MIPPPVCNCVHTTSGYEYCCANGDAACRLWNKWVTFITYSARRPNRNTGIATSSYVASVNSDEAEALDARNLALLRIRQRATQHQ